LREETPQAGKAELLKKNAELPAAPAAKMNGNIGKAATGSQHHTAERRQTGNNGSP